MQQTEEVAGANARAWFRALDHGRLTGQQPFWRVGDYYTFTSKRTGELYRVDRVIRGRHMTYTCTCPAGTTGKVCWHKALVAALPREVTLRREWREPGHAGCMSCGDNYNEAYCRYCDADAIPNQIVAC